MTDGQPTFLRLRFRRLGQLFLASMAVATISCGEAKTVIDKDEDSGQAQAAASAAERPATGRTGRLHGTAYGYTNICLVFDEASLRPSQIAAALKVIETRKGEFAAFEWRLSGLSVRNRNRATVLPGCLRQLDGATAENTLVEIYYSVDGILHSDISRGRYESVSVRPYWRDLSSFSLEDFTRMIVDGQLAIARDPGRYMATK
jgi:hypothetical protein